MAITSVVRPIRSAAIVAKRCIHLDARHRLSRIYVPDTPFIHNIKQQQQQTKPATAAALGHELLLRCGFIHQPEQRAGVLHFLPLGTRVLAHLEALADRHMRSLGAAKLSLSSLSSERVWRRSGRLSGNAGDNNELFGLFDRRRKEKSSPLSSGLLLCPTHEEEISMLLAKAVLPARRFPLRLYQVSRKYRNEARPRAGLLRAKEFIMKDMYSFDADEEAALETYHLTRQAYHHFFTDLQIPFVVAEADSGNMGGNLSHEYHYESEVGEDIVWKCSNCHYAANDEVVTHRPRVFSPNPDMKIWHGLSTDRSTLVHTIYPIVQAPDGPGSLSHLNLSALKTIFSDLDFDVSHLKTPLPSDKKHAVLLHPAIAPDINLESLLQTYQLPPPTSVASTEMDFVRTVSGDSCPRCSDGTLSPKRTIEVGHTFFLGTRYSSVFNVLARGTHSDSHVQMGCYGIGISRLVGAIAETSRSAVHVPSSKHEQHRQVMGLQWPVAVAPYKVLIVCESTGENLRDAETIYDDLERLAPELRDQVLLDDRAVSMSWKMTDADLRGVPITLIIGRIWKEGSRRVEMVVKRVDKHASVEAGNDLAAAIRESLASLSGKQLW